MVYQTVDVPQGNFIGWGNKPGQIVEGVVTDYDPTGATDFNKKECPALEIELIRTAHSYSKQNNSWSSYESGETVQLSCGQVQLKKKVRKAQPRIGDRIRIELGNPVRVDSGEVKTFTVDVDHSPAAGNGSAAAAEPPQPAEDHWSSTPPVSASFGGDSDEPPF
jgi:hypothetical protein